MIITVSLSIILDNILFRARYFYNNNVWVYRGLNELGNYLTSTGINTTLGAQALAGAADIKSALDKSVAACTVPSPVTNGVFLPPYAELNATPYV